MQFCTRRLFKMVCLFSLAMCTYLPAMEQEEDNNGNNGKGSSSPRQLSSSALFCFGSPGSPNRSPTPATNDTEKREESPKPNTQMRDAIKRGDLVGLQKIARDQLRLTAVYEGLLSAAIKKNRTDIIKFLVQEIAFPLKTDSYSDQENFNAVELALKYDFHRADTEFANLPLRNAIIHGTSDVVSLLLDLAAHYDIDLINADITTEQGARSPLRFAIELNRVKIVKILIAHGARLSSQESSEKSIKELIEELGTKEMKNVLMSREPVSMVRQNGLPFVAGLSAGSILLLLFYIIFASTTCSGLNEY